MFFAVDVKLTWAICSHVAIKAGASVRIVSIRTRSIHARVLVTIIAFWNINLRNMFHISENYSLWYLVLEYICFVRYQVSTNKSIHKHKELKLIFGSTRFVIIRHTTYRKKTQLPVHFCPSHAPVQLQVYPSDPSMQVAPFAHGRDSHSFTS